MHGQSFKERFKKGFQEGFQARQNNNDPDQGFSIGLGGWIVLLFVILILFVGPIYLIYRFIRFLFKSKKKSE